MIVNKEIDAGKPFDWGKTSGDYAKYRDIYPDIFYKKISDRGLCVKGQRVLDLGTGTGVLPRNMYSYGAEWTGTDISENQIAEAKRLSAERGLKINYSAVATEEIDFSDGAFDVITACQCFWYFDHKRVMPKLARMLKKNGSLLLLYMAWLPFEDKVAGASEALVLKYNPKWSGEGETRHPITVPECVYEEFYEAYSEEYDLDVPFTRESWHGRMKACRGVGASLSREELERWEKEHKELLQETAPNEFTVKHYAAMLELKKR
ncbi:MAG: class I SAM-dependent methyltransferase [Ruminococcaceae bacterium]|nr:class I SAM-dependent methyltransferase [Oscillospiraceae bacterium]